MSPDPVPPELFRSWVVWDSGAWLALNKPAGVACHRSADPGGGPFLQAARLYGGVSRIHLLHRLDQVASGLVLVLRDRDLASLAQQSIADGLVDRVYLAILEGLLARPVRVDLPLTRGRFEGGRWKVRPAADPSRPAFTWFHPLSQREGCTLVKACPGTGRTHQIRAHAASLGSPVCGDRTYGSSLSLKSPFGPAIALHCLRMGFPSERLPESVSAPPDLRAWGW